MNTVEDIEKLGQRVAGSARPGEEVEAYVVHRRDLDVKVLKGEVEALSSAETGGVGVRVIAGHRQGFAYAGVLSDESADEVLAEARDNAVYGTPDEALGLPSDTTVAAGGPVLSLVAPDFAAYGVDAKVALTLDLERRTFAADPRITVVEACEYGDVWVRSAVANSHGIAASQERTSASLGVSAIASDGHQTQTGFGLDLARDPASLDAGRAAAEASERAVRLLGAVQPRSQRVTVVLDAFVTASFVGIIAGTLSGDAVVKGRSIFADRLGKEIASGVVSLADDPVDPTSFGATAFDAEGVPTARVPFVVDGVLERFAHNSYTANRLGTSTTANAVRASYMSTPGVGMRSVGFAPGTAAFDALLRQADGGVYIQSVQGLHSGVNPVSGDFSAGADGCWISGGTLGAPIREATIASTLQRMLKDVAAVGCEVRMLSHGPAVPVLIGEMTLGGK